MWLPYFLVAVLLLLLLVLLLIVLLFLLLLFLSLPGFTDVVPCACFVFVASPPQSYLIRSRSKKHEEGSPSPVKTLRSPGGTRTVVEEGDEDDVKDATKELLDLKTRSVGNFSPRVQNLYLLRGSIVDRTKYC